MKAKTQMKKTWIVLALIAVLSFSSLGAIYASTTPDYMSAAMSLTSLNARIANLDAADVQNLVTIAGKMNNALFSGINGNPAILDSAEKQCLYNTYKINQSILPMIMNGGFVYYIENASSHGSSGYAGFIDAVQTSNLEYLADLLRFTNDAALEEFKNQLEFYGLTYAEQLAIYSQLVQVEFEPGLAFTPAVIQQYEAILQDITAKSSGGNAQLTLQMLANCGITVENIEAVFNQLSDADKQTLEGILDKMGLIIHNPVGLTATYEPADGATDVPVAATVSVTFNKSVSEVNLQGITIVPEDGPALTGLSYALADKVLTINHPDFDFLTGYTVTVPANAVKSDADEFNEELSWSFTTVEPGPADKPVATYVPADGSVNVPLTATVKAKFNMTVSAVDLREITITTEDGELAGVSAQVSGKVLTISHPDFDYLTEYTVEVPDGAVKSSAEVTNDSFSWAFTTVEEGGVVVPGKYALTVDTDKQSYLLGEDVTVSGFVYENGEVKTYLPNISVGLVLSKGDTAVFFGQVSTDENGKYEWAIPNENLELGDYTILATSNLAAAHTAFSVVKEDEPVGKPAIEKYVPVKDDTGVSLTSEVSATFNMDVTAVDLEGVKIEKDGTELSDVTATLNGRVLTISHPKFSYKTYYTVIIPAGTVLGATGLQNDADEWTFRTRSRNSNGGGSNNDPPEDNDECTFTDLKSTHWAYEIITGLCEQGIVDGYPNGSFQPEGTITRAELTKLFVEAMDLRITQPQDPTFSDVVPGAWYYKYVETAVEAGLVKGYENGEFHPDARITRQEIAAIVARALDMEEEAAEAALEDTGFTDDEQIAAWAKGYVVIEHREGIVDGYPDKSFAPLNNATRAEACAMLSRYMEKMDE